MTPKETAIKLYEKFYYKIPTLLDDKTLDCLAQECALIAVDLHLEELSKMKLIFSDRELHYKYWQEVKQEIEKL
jgi:hypothetical protein